MSSSCYQFKGRSFNRISWRQTNKRLKQSNSHSTNKQVKEFRAQTYTPLSLSHSLSQNRYTIMGLTTEIHPNYLRHTFISEFLGAKLTTTKAQRKKNQQNMVNNYKRYKEKDSRRKREECVGCKGSGSGSQTITSNFISKAMLVRLILNTRVHVMNIM